MRGSSVREDLELPAIAATVVPSLNFQLTLFPPQPWRSPRGVVLVEMRREPLVGDDLPDLIGEGLREATLSTRIYWELFVLLGEPRHGRLITSVPQALIDNRRDPPTAEKLIEILLREIARAIDGRYLTFT